MSVRNFQVQGRVSRLERDGTDGRVLLTGRTGEAWVHVPLFLVPVLERLVDRRVCISTSVSEVSR